VTGRARGAPDVSVVIPVRDGEALLPAAVDSVRRQSWPPREIVVVDDGSTDGTAALARRLGPDVRLVQQPPRGLPATRNHGLRVARGELIAYLDSDDEWTERKLEWLVPVLDGHPEIDVVLGHTQRMWSVPADAGAAARTERTEPELALHLGAAVCRRRAFDRFGAFDETYSHSDDWDWFMRVREGGGVIVVHPEVTLLYRRHGKNLSNDVVRGTADLVQTLRRSLARRRAAGGALDSLPELPSLRAYLAQPAVDRPARSDC
jgi:glycosyltransferase involved in cell wall biosynthesis